MSDFHVLEINDLKDKARVGFHFDTPAGNNAANVSFATALAQWKAPVTAIPGLGQTEKDAIAAGTVIEHVETVQLNANATNGQKQAAIQAKWTALNATIPGKIAENLKFWGFAGDVS